MEVSAPPKRKRRRVGRKSTVRQCADCLIDKMRKAGLKQVRISFTEYSRWGCESYDPYRAVITWRGGQDELPAWQLVALGSDGLKAYAKQLVSNGHSGRVSCDGDRSWR